MARTPQVGPVDQGGTSSPFRALQVEHRVPEAAVVALSALRLRVGKAVGAGNVWKLRCHSRRSKPWVLTIAKSESAKAVATEDPAKTQS